MSNGQIITINQDLLLAPDIEGTEVTFEIRPNDYFTERVKEEGLEKLISRATGKNKKELQIDQLKMKI